MATGMQRRLSAILAADIVGYSRLVRADEDGTIAAVNTLRRDVIEPLLATHNGRVVKLMGDGILVEFASVVDAVRAALEVQEAVTAQVADMPEDRRLRFRIGVNLGDVVIDGDDIHGDGVNIAARLEALAAPGGICISGAVHDQVKKRVPQTFTDMGEQTVKNIDEPVRVWQWASETLPETAGSPAAPTSAPSLPDRPSIAVLPFANMSGDPDQDYFADGIAEDIITALSRARWLFVIARNSSFSYKGRNVDVKVVGRELGVRYVLEGSVRKAMSRVRITGQLIEAATSLHLWADRFDGEMADIFDLQDQVTSSVVGAISPRLEEAEMERARLKPTEDLDAYDFYLRGLDAFHRYTPSGNAEASEMFGHAIEHDPDYAAAYGFAARCFAQRMGFGWMDDPEREAVEAMALARKAVRLGRNDAIALANAGFVLALFGAVDEGSAQIEKALTINPNLATAWHVGAVAAVFRGDTGMCLEHASRAIRLSPQDPQEFAMHAMSGLAHFLAGRVDEAVSCAERALSENPKFTVTSGVLAASYAVSGRQADAAEAMARLCELAPKLRSSNLTSWLPFTHTRDMDRWVEGLRRAGLPE